MHHVDTVAGACLRYLLLDRGQVVASLDEIGDLSGIVVYRGRAEIPLLKVSEWDRSLRKCREPLFPSSCWRNRDGVIGRPSLEVGTETRCRDCLVVRRDGAEVLSPRAAGIATCRDHGHIVPESM